MFADPKQTYFRHLEARHLSYRTLANYAEAINQFEAFVLAADYRRRPESITSDDADAFLTHLRRLGRARNTLNNRARSLKTFTAWLARAGHLPADPLAAWRIPPSRTQPVRPFTLGEIDRLILATRSYPPTALRDQAIIAVLYNTGLRAGELCTLRRSDITEGAVRVRGKGDRTRIVGVEPTAWALLMTHLAPIRSGNGRYAFSGLTASGLYQLLSRLARVAGVPDVHPHRFRHTFAVEFLRNGGQIHNLQTILGHSRIETTMRYAAYEQAERAVEEQRRLAPFAAAG